MANIPPFSGVGNDLTNPITPADYVNEIQDNFAKCRDEILGLDTRIAAITGPLTTVNMSRRVIATPIDVLVPATDGLLLVDTTGGAATLTLPLASSAPPDNKLRVYYIQQTAGANRLSVVCTGPDVFPNGASKIVLPATSGGGMWVGVWNDGAGDDKWIYGPVAQSFVQMTHGLPAIPAATFLFPIFYTPPWATLVDNLNDAFFTATPGVALITSLVDQDVFISYRFSIDSTGGAAYTIATGLSVNGVAVADSIMVNQKAANADIAVQSNVRKLHLNAGDTVVPWVTHAGLTGNLIGADVSIWAAT